MPWVLGAAAVVPLAGIAGAATMVWLRRRRTTAAAAADAARGTLDVVVFGEPDGGT